MVKLDDLNHALQIKKIIAMYLKDTNDYIGLNRRVNYGVINKLNVYELINSKNASLSDLMRVYSKIPKSYFSSKLKEEKNKRK